MEEGGQEGAGGRVLKDLGAPVREGKLERARKQTG